MLHLQGILIQSVCETVYGYLLTYPFCATCPRSAQVIHQIKPKTSLMSRPSKNFQLFPL